MILGGVVTTRRVIAYVVSILMFMPCPAASVAGQQRRGPSAPSPGERIRSDQTRIIERESIRSEMKASANPKRDPAETATLKQMSEDFTRLQLLNGELMKAASNNGAPLDYKWLVAGATEVHKRAARLRNNLVLGGGEKAGGKNQRRLEKLPDAATDKDVRTLILALGERINSFVTNPYFKIPLTVNPQHIEAASRDLRSIIEISKEAGKVADKLGRK